MFWFKLLTGKQQKLSSVMYKLLRAKHDNADDQYESRWLAKIKSILYDAELGYMWVAQENLNLSIAQFRSITSDALDKSWEQWWSEEINRNTKCTFYRLTREKKRIIGNILMTFLS